MMEAEARIVEPSEPRKELADGRKTNAFDDLELRVRVHDDFVQSAMRGQQETPAGAELQTVASIERAPARDAQRLDEMMRLAEHVRAAQRFDEIRPAGGQVGERAQTRHALVHEAHAIEAIELHDGERARCAT